MTARLLLDTHALIWLLDGSPRLGRHTRTHIDDADELHVSVASLWEITIKTSLGRLPAVPELLATLTAGDVRRLGIEGSHLEALATLPWHEGHRDPFDRMLLAQAQAENLVLVTSDREMDTYGVQVQIAAD